jgi:peroxin-12
MIFLVGVPYLLRKLEARMKEIKEKLEDELTTDDKIPLIQLYSYRTLKVTLTIAQIVRYVSYLSGKSPSHSLQLMVSGIGLRHSQPTSNPLSWSEIVKGNVRVSALLSTLLLRSLEFGGFFLQFLQWWNESSTTSQTISKMSIPEPPPYDINAHRYYNTCPICLQDFQIATILRISGYVFCYKCITKHLKKHNFCPVTNYPATVDDLVRIFDN